MAAMYQKRMMNVFKEMLDECNAELLFDEFQVEYIIFVNYLILHKFHL